MRVGYSSLTAPITRCPQRLRNLVNRLLRSFNIQHPHTTTATLLLGDKCQPTAPPLKPRLKRRHLIGRINGGCDGGSRHKVSSGLTLRLTDPAPVTHCM